VNRLIISIIFLFAFGLSVFFGLPYVDKVLVYESPSFPKTVDAVIVLEGGIGQRVTEGVALLEKTEASYLIMTGGAYFHTTSPRLMGQFAKRLSNNLPEILYEENSLSTYDHPINLMPIFNHYNIRSFIVVTSQYHTARTKAVFDAYFKGQKNDFEVYIHGASDGIDYSRWWKDHEMKQRVGIELLKRIYYFLN